MVILLNPKSARYGIRVPNSILTLGAFLEGKYKYELVDQNLDPHVVRTLVNLIKERDTKYLGITVMPGPQLHQAIPISKKIKSLFPRIKIIWGGYFPSFHPNTVLTGEYVDYVFRGHAEYSFVDFLDYLERKPGAKHLNEIEGLSYRENGKVVHNERHPFMDPDEIPLLPYHRVNMEGYFRMGKTYLGSRTVGYLSSIGCPFLCGFCAIAGLYKGKWLGREPGLVYDHLKFLKDKYNIGAVEFHDDNFFVSEKRAYEIAEKIRGLKVGWWAEARPDTMMKFSDETFEMLRSSGLKMVFYGAESSSADSLELMNKGGTQTPETVLDLAERSKRFDIIPEFSFVLGSPSEDVGRDIDNDIRYIRKIKQVNPLAEIIFYIYSPVNFEDSEISLAAKLKGFDYPKTLDEWLSPQWKYFDVRKYPQTPWLKPHHVRKIINFEKTLNAYYPTVSDTKLRGWRKNLLRFMGSWRYLNSVYTAPYELKIAMRLMKYRQPEVEGFAFEN